MTTPLPPNFNYVSGDKSTCLFMKQGDPLPSPLITESPDTEQSVTITATPAFVGMTIRNDALTPDGVATLQVTNAGAAALQTTAGTTQLLDTSVSVGSGTANSAVTLLGSSGATTTISQIGNRTRIVNNKQTDSGAVQVFASTNSVQYILAPRDKNAGIQVYNSTYYTSSRSAEFGLSEGGMAYMQTNGGSGLALNEDILNLGTGGGTPFLYTKGLAGDGRVYDTRFNTIYNPQEVVTTGPVLSGLSTFNVTIPQGKYQLQVRANMVNNNCITAGRGIRIWMQRALGESPSDYQENSEVHMMSTMVYLPPGVGELANANFMSGIFETGSDENWSVYVSTLVSGQWQFGDVGTDTGLYITPWRIGEVVL